jgi:hypothetical protein
MSSFPRLRKVGFPKSIDKRIVTAPGKWWRRKCRRAAHVQAGCHTRMQSGDTYVVLDLVLGVISLLLLAQL